MPQGAIQSIDNAGDTDRTKIAFFDDLDQLISARDPAPGVFVEDTYGGDVQRKGQMQNVRVARNQCPTALQQCRHTRQIVFFEGDYPTSVRLRKIIDLFPLGEGKEENRPGTPLDHTTNDVIQLTAIQACSLSPTKIDSHHMPRAELAIEIPLTKLISLTLAGRPTHISTRLDAKQTYQ